MVDFTEDADDEGIATEKNESTPPNNEPMLPMRNGIAMPCKHFRVTCESVNEGGCDSLSSNCTFDVDDESRAKTSEAGRNMVQHQS